ADCLAAVCAKGQSPKDARHPHLSGRHRGRGARGRRGRLPSQAEQPHHSRRYNTPPARPAPPDSLRDSSKVRTRANVAPRFELSAFFSHNARLLARSRKGLCVQAARPPVSSRSHATSDGRPAPPPACFFTRHFLEEQKGIVHLVHCITAHTL